MTKGGSVLLLLGAAIVTGIACSPTNNTTVGDAGSSSGGSSSGATSVEDAGVQVCASCSTPPSCTSQTPVQACCTCAGAPSGALSRATGLHRYSAAPGASMTPDLGCLSSPGTLGTPKMVTLTGYVWLFSSGYTDSSGNPGSSDVKVEVYTENHPSTPDGSISASPIGSYTTSPSDPADPIDTTWNHNCPGPSGCNFRRYTIPNVPTETPLVIKTSDAGMGLWATLYDYNVYFSSSVVQAGDGGTPTVKYDATAVGGGDPGTVAGSVGLTPDSSQGMLAGEVHDCGDVRLSGAVVGTAQSGTTIYYSTTDEGNPLLSVSAKSTSDLSLFGAINLPTGRPLRVTAVGEDPKDPGKDLMLGTYVVQLYPGAVTALSFRGRRPWQQ